MKKTLSLALCALLLLSALPLFALPASMISSVNLNVDKLYAFVGDKLQ